MENKFTKLKKVFGVGALAGMLLLPTGVTEVGATTMDGKIDGRCDLVIDANRHEDHRYLAEATGGCKGVIRGQALSPSSIWLLGPENTRQVYDGDVVIAGVPPVGQYEVHVKVIPAKGHTNPVNPNKPKPEKPVTPVFKYFKDVPDKHWASNNVNTMHEKGIINGYPDGTYKPNQSISRLHVTTLMARTIDLAPIREGKEFKDVPKSHKSYQDVQKLYRAGIFDGKEDGEFGINDNLTRAQMAKVIAKAFDIERINMADNDIFTDVTTDHWAYDHIVALYEQNITFGDNGMFRPNDPVTRAQYAAFLHRAMEYKEQYDRINNK